MDEQIIQNLRFLNVYSEKSIHLIKKEFNRFKGQCYLDHAGSTLYSQVQIADIFHDFQNNCFGNPHAKNTPSNLTEDIIEQTRHQILQHFNTDSEKYSVIFTSGATHSLKLVAESFNCNNSAKQKGTFAYLEDNHTSVLGMREYFDEIKPLLSKEVFQIFNSKYSELNSELKNCSNSLFVYPAQSNFSGFKYPLIWSELVQKGILNNIFPEDRKSRWFCMLDATAFVPTNPLDLTLHSPDFVSLSFHKIFGYPTGLGVLLVKNTSDQVLNKKYFGGGSVSMVVSNEKIHISRKLLHERFEDGTLPFLSIIAIRHGFNTLKRLQISFELISQHTFNLGKYVYLHLLHLHHSNGEPVAILYHNSQFENISCQGGIVNFNLLRSNGEYIGFSEVQHISNLFGIHLRTGCSCNPGACQRFLKLSPDLIKKHFELGHVCGDENDLIDGHPTGSVRISFGYMSTKEDADTFLNTIIDCFVQKPVIYKVPKNIPENENLFNEFNNNNHNITLSHEISLDNLNNSSLTEKKLNLNEENSTKNGEINANLNRFEGKLISVFIYPIKSCGSFEIKGSWEIVSTGLKYDRQWMIINACGVGLTQKRERRLCLLKPSIDISKGTLDLEFEEHVFKSIPLNISKTQKLKASKCLSKVCGDKIEGWDCGDDVADWLQNVLNIKGLRLIKHCTEEEYSKPRFSKNSSNSVISLSNEAQFLLINSQSIRYILEKLAEENFVESFENFVARFRPNFVVDLKTPFAENKMSEIHLGNLKLKFSGNCNRCQMIGINQFSSERSHEPLQVLSENFGGKIKFGVYLSQTEKCNNNFINLNDTVIFYLQ